MEKMATKKELVMRYVISGFHLSVYGMFEKALYMIRRMKDEDKLKLHDEMLSQPCQKALQMSYGYHKPIQSNNS